MTRYYSWEDDPCRVHESPEGKLTADIYRAGRGIVETDPIDVKWGSREISYGEYQELVREAIELHKRKKAGA